VVENTGGTEGTYAAILSVDGVTAETKEVTLTPGSSKVVAFSLAKDTPGTCKIGIGELSSSLTVKEELIAKEIELKYDDGDADGFSSTGPQGYSVHFSSPATPFTITKVKIMAGLYGKEHIGRKALLQIWNQAFGVLWSREMPAAEFTDEGEWVTVETNVTVDGDFRVVFFTGGAPKEGGIKIGADTDIVNKGSEVVLPDRTIRQWPPNPVWKWPEDATNWMIRVVGTATPAAATEPTPVPSSAPMPTVGEIELKHDDGTEEGFCSSGRQGFLVHFSPPAIPFNVNEVKLFTSLQGSAYESQTTWLEIRDHNLELLYDQEKTATTYSSKPTWITIETPGIQVNDDFYIAFYTSSKREGGVYVHYDLSQTNNHSEMVEYGGKITDWIWGSPKEKTNWMIRVVGESTDEIVSAPSLSFQEIEGTAEFQETVISLDTPEKLSSWMVENIIGESTYEHEKETGVIYTPLPDEVYEIKRGNCRAFAVFACYILQYHGYEAKMLGIKVDSDESMNHVVCAYAHDSLLYAINNGWIEGPYHTYEEIASNHHEDWSRYEIHCSWYKYQKLEPPDEVIYED